MHFVEKVFLCPRFLRHKFNLASQTWHLRHPCGRKGRNIHKSCSLNIIFPPFTFSPWAPEVEEVLRFLDMLPPLGMDLFWGAIYIDSCAHQYSKGGQILLPWRSTSPHILFSCNYPPHNDSLQPQAVQAQPVRPWVNKKGSIQKVTAFSFVLAVLAVLGGLPTPE